MHNENLAEILNNKQGCGTEYHKLLKRLGEGGGEFFLITKDFLFDDDCGIYKESCAGIAGVEDSLRRDFWDEYKHKISLDELIKYTIPYKFKLCDADDNLMYEGYSKNYDPAPFDFFGEAQGCNKLYFLNNMKEKWELLCFKDDKGFEE